MTTRRTYWHSDDLSITNEPLSVSLIKYRQKKNRQRVTDSRLEFPNLVSSLTEDGRQMPIIDLDFDFHLEPSSTPGHYHLYLKTGNFGPIRRFFSVRLLHVIWSWVFRA